MPKDRLERSLQAELDWLAAQGRRKGRETVIAGIVRGGGGHGPRYRIVGEGDRAFLRMNANNYLGMATVPEVIAAEEAAVRSFGAGPGAVRFISGTWAPHVELERRLAAFHGRDAAMIFSSAYATVIGVIAPLVTADTAVISDALNHNSIINAIKLTRPALKSVYRHLDYGELDACLADAAKSCKQIGRAHV